MGFAELQLAPNLFDLSRSATLGVGWMNLGVSVAKRAAQLRSQVLGLHFRLPMLQLQKIDMQKHHESKAHKAAVKFWLKEGGCVGLWQDMAYSPLGVVAISSPALLCCFVPFHGRAHFLVRLLLLRPSNTREVLTQQPAKHYLVEPYENIIECTRNSIFWIYTNMNPYMKPRHKDEVQVSILPRDQQPDEHLVFALPLSSAEPRTDAGQ